MEKSMTRSFLRKTWCLGKPFLTATNLTFGRKDYFIFSGCTGSIAVAFQLLSLGRGTCYPWDTTKKWNEYTTYPLQIVRLDWVD